NLQKTMIPGSPRPDEARLLTLLAPDRTIDRKICIVLAHPDDETIGLGGQLPRMQNATVVVVTDGAPRNLADAARLGFASAAAYATARRDDLLCALALAGIGEDGLMMLGVPDQESAFHLTAIARSLDNLF